MDPKLAFGVATFLAGIATSMSTAQHGWSDLATPGFVGGLLLQLSGFILSVWGGINTKAPRDEEARTRASDVSADPKAIPPASSAPAVGRRIGAVFVAIALSTAVSACHPNLTNLPPASIQEYSADQVVKAVNDITTAAITANHQGALPDAAEKVVLTVNKEVLDTITANPQGYKAATLTIIQNAKQGLPADLQAKVNGYLDQVVGFLQGAK